MSESDIAYYIQSGFRFGCLSFFSWRLCFKTPLELPLFSDILSQTHRHAHSVCLAAVKPWASASLPGCCLPVRFQANPRPPRCDFCQSSSCGLLIRASETTKKHTQQPSPQLQQQQQWELFLFYFFCFGMEPLSRGITLKKTGAVAFGQGLCLDDLGWAAQTHNFPLHPVYSSISHPLAVSVD